MPGRTLPQQLDEMSDGNGVHGGGSWRQAGGPESTPEDLSLGVSRGGEEGGRPPAWRSHDTGLRGSAPSLGKRNDPVTLGGRAGDESACALRGRLPLLQDTHTGGVRGQREGCDASTTQKRFLYGLTV